MAKKDKASVDYSKGMKSSHCGNCEHFIGPHSCALVKGEIDSSMWCKLWKRD